MKGSKQRTMKKLRNSVDTTKYMSILTKVTLPYHVVLDHILPRLPIKTLIRFKSVSKSWYSFISSSQFAKSCLRFHDNKKEKLLFLVESPPAYFFSLSYDEFDNLRDVVQVDEIPDYNLPVLFEFGFVGSANGLVCLWYRRCGRGIEYTEFYICNPATRQYHKITNPEPQQLPYSDDFWFGYVPSMDDYMIVAAFVPYEETYDSPLYGQVYVFSLNTGEWKRIKDPDKLFERTMRGSKLVDGSTVKLFMGTKVIDGILFWSLKSIRKGMGLPVLGFDLVNQQLKEFPSLKWLEITDDDDSYRCIRFLEIKGCLAIYTQTRRHVSEIWILKQYDNWNSWEKLSSYNHRMKLCHVTSTGKYLVMVDSVEIYENKYQSVQTLKIIDPSKKDTELQSQELKFTKCALLLSDAVDYVESLVSPFGKLFNLINSS